MKKSLIEKYALGWNYRSNEGQINLKLKGSFKEGKHKFKVSSVNEFNAIEAVLQNSPVYINEKGWIYNSEMETPGAL